MQSLLQKHLDWDEPLDPDLHKKWQSIAMDIGQLPHFSTNRRYFKTTFEKSHAELHLFADVSTKAYSSVAFFKLQHQTSFIMAKTRVAPLKSPTLPRLELMTILTATRLVKFIITSLQLQNTPVFIWTDSQIVLYWIHSPKKLPQFISHRVSEIHQVVPSASWKYCPTKDSTDKRHYIQPVPILYVVAIRSILATIRISLASVEPH